MWTWTRRLRRSWTFRLPRSRRRPDHRRLSWGDGAPQPLTLRFARFGFAPVLSIRKSWTFLPSLIAAASQRGFAPRPAHVSPPGPRYFGATFVPLRLLRPLLTTE